MLERDQILHLLEYHHWAGDRAFEALAAVSAAQLDQSSGGSFGTGRALVRHIVGVEWLWHERWHGNSPPALPDYPATFAGRDFQAEWQRSKHNQERFIGELASDQLGVELTYTNFKGVRCTYTFADLLMHLVNHGTYHRGQVTHLLRDLNLPAASTDYLLYLDELRED